MIGNYLIIYGSGKRGSNPWPSAWEADALPTELLPRYFYAAKVEFIFDNSQFLFAFFLSFPIRIQATRLWELEIFTEPGEPVKFLILAYS